MRNRETRSYARLGMVLILATVLPARAATEQVTDTAKDESWGSRHGTTSQGRVLWIEEDGGQLRDVYFDDGAGATLVQAYDGNEVEPGSAFGLGSGAVPGQVIGAWRRGTDFAWLWIDDGGAPVEIDTKLGNPFDPTQPSNPEALSVADGCVFLVLQAFDPDTNSNVKHVYRIDTATGDPVSLSGSASVPGADRVRSSECQAAWVFAADDTAPRQLVFHDGSCPDAACVATIDSGALDSTGFAVEQGKIVYAKEVDGIRQIFLYDTSAISPVSFRITPDGSPEAWAPQTDGRHVAYMQSNLDGSADIHLNGGLRLTDSTNRPSSGFGVEFPFVLDRGQLIWRDESGRLHSLVDNRIATVDVSPALSVTDPWLADGAIVWYGTSDDGGADDEVFRFPGAPPSDGSQPAPPMRVTAKARAGTITVQWDRVLGAGSYNLYYAAEPGVSPQNYASLAAGTRVTGAESPFTLPGAQNGATYSFVVSSTEAGIEGPPSGEAAVAVLTLDVDSEVDAPDADPGDGLCADASGSCTLRAAIQEASALNACVTVAVPAGVYALSIAGSGENLGATGDLDLNGELILQGAGQDVTFIDGGQIDRVLEVDSLRVGGIESEIADLTVRNGTIGIANPGRLRLQRVTVGPNGGPAVAWAGAGIWCTGPSAWLEATDSHIVQNVTTSHGGGIFAAGDVVLVRTEVGDNIAGIGGGGIYLFQGRTTLIDSDIRGNSSRFAQDWPGGGIYNEGRELILIRSLVRDNDSPDGGGGIYNEAGTLLAFNSTISGNSCDVQGGGVYNRGFSNGSSAFARLHNVTIHGNSANQGGGLSNSSFASAVVANSIFAGNTGLLGLPENCAGQTAQIASQGYNLDDGNTCNLVQGTDQVNTDPLLGPLSDNGGPTPTHALAAASSATDAGDPAGCAGSGTALLTTDQRGGQRPHDGDSDGSAICDSGAFEFLGACVDADGDGFGSPGNPLCAAGASADCDDTNAAVHPGAPELCDGLNNDCTHGAWPAVGGTVESDDDDDGVAECAGDCDDSDAAAWATPAEVPNVGFEDRSTLAWLPPAEPGAASLTYDTLRSDDPADFETAAVCIETDDGFDRSATDTEDPAAGLVRAYLVRARNRCPAGFGSLGSGTSGQPRGGVGCP